jgi:putative permease
MDVVKAWFQRYFSDPQVVILTMLLLLGFVAIALFGDMLAPVLAALVIAYLLDGVVNWLGRFRLPRLVVVWLVSLLFVVLLVAVLFGFIPLLSQQLTELVQQMPNMVSAGQKLLFQLPERYPDLFSREQVQNLIDTLRSEAGRFGQAAVAYSVASIPNLVTLIVYLILLPLLVFFFLKDKVQLVRWFVGYMPRDSRLAANVWNEVNVQLGNYIRGKVWEILVVGVVSYVVFLIFGLQYATLLAVLVGLSVIIPYIGATVVTIPVMLIAWFQWGWSWDFIYVSVAYLVIQALDGSVLVPLLFSEVVNLHPIAIIVAVLVFGGLWGFWGVFFAIPLATLVNAVLMAWPGNMDARSAEGSQAQD